MKKKLLLVVILMGALFLTGCGNIEGSLEDIMAKVYANIPENERPMMLMNTEINDENVEYFLGSKDIEYEEALASEPGIGSIAHSVVLVRTKKGADKIEKNVDPRKWVCVGVEKDDIIVESEGDLIILIMVEDEKTRDKLEDSFDNLK